MNRHIKLWQATRKTMKHCTSQLLLYLQQSVHKHLQLSYRTGMVCHAVLIHACHILSHSQAPSYISADNYIHRLLRRSYVTSTATSVREITLHDHVSTYIAVIVCHTILLPSLFWRSNWGDFVPSALSIGAGTNITKRILLQLSR